MWRRLQIPASSPMQVRSTLLLQLKKTPVIPSATEAAGDLFLCEDHESTTRIGERSFGDPSTAALSLRAAWGELGILWTIAGVAILTRRRIVRAWQTALSSSAGTQSAARMEESTWSHLLRMTMS